MPIEITRNGYHRLMNGDVQVSQHAAKEEAYERVSQLPNGTYRILTADETVVVTGQVAAPAPVPPAPAPVPSPSPNPVNSTGFNSRPFLFKADENRLRASIAASDPEAVGTSSNINGQPQGFLTRINQIYTNPGQTSLYWVAMAAWLQNNTIMQSSVRDQVMSIVNAAPNGLTGHGEGFQHHEDTILRVAASVDLCFNAFNAADLSLVASYVNGTCDNWVREKNTFWPGDSPFNNYWQNGFLGMVAAGICTEGFNTRASEWRSLAQTMANQYAQAATINYSGPVQTEGHYYGQHVFHAIWGMKLFDNVMGTRLLENTRFNATEHLQLQMYQQRSNLVNFFHVGSEANDVSAPHGFLTLPYWHLLITLAQESGQIQIASEAKAMLQRVMPQIIWFQFSKAPFNFYWNIRNVPIVPLSSKLDKMYSAPTPGAGLVGVRSTNGWEPGPSARAALMFATQFGGNPGAHWSHSNADSPGFQWDANGDWIVTDPGFFNRSGILGEAGSAHQASISNMVFLNGLESNYAGAQPKLIFAENNLNQNTPHFYIQIDAQPYWSNTSYYKRDYVWLEDLKVVVIWDRIIGGPSKSWRIHTTTLPTINTNEVVVTTPQNKQLKVVDAFSENNWIVDDLLSLGITTSPCYRLRQENSTNNYKSIKVLDIDNQVTAVTSETGIDWSQVSLVINGNTKTIRFFDDGSHALIN